MKGWSQMSEGSCSETDPSPLIFQRPRRGGDATPIARWTAAWSPSTRAMCGVPRWTAMRSPTANHLLAGCGAAGRVDEGIFDDGSRVVCVGWPQVPRLRSVEPDNDDVEAVVVNGEAWFGTGEGHEKVAVDRSAVDGVGEQIAESVNVRVEQFEGSNLEGAGAEHSTSVTHWLRRCAEWSQLGCRGGSDDFVDPSRHFTDIHRVAGDGTRNVTESGVEFCKRRHPSSVEDVWPHVSHRACKVGVRRDRRRPATRANNPNPTVQAATTASDISQRDVEPSRSASLNASLDQ